MKLVLVSFILFYSATCALINIVSHFTFKCLRGVHVLREALVMDCLCPCVDHTPDVQVLSKLQARVLLIATSYHTVTLILSVLSNETQVTKLRVSIMSLKHHNART